MILLSIRLCKRTGISIDELCGLTRKAHICEIRQLWWKLLSEKGKWSNSYIGQLCGGRNSATVHHGVKRINGLLEVKDPRVTAAWEIIKDLEIKSRKK